MKRTRVEKMKFLNRWFTQSRYTNTPTRLAMKCVTKFTMLAGLSDRDCLGLFFKYLIEDGSNMTESVFRKQDWFHILTNIA